MIKEEQLMKILYAPHSSEKSSRSMEMINTFVVKVAKNSTKSMIKSAIYKIFNVKVKSINTLIIKGKFKCHGKYTGHRKDWKKAYITLGEGQRMDFYDKSE